MSHVSKYPLRDLLIDFLCGVAGDSSTKPNELILVGSTILFCLLKASDLPPDFWDNLPDVLAEGLKDARAKRALVIVIRRVVDSCGPQDTNIDHELVARLREVALFFDPSGEVRLPPKGGEPSFD